MVPHAQKDQYQQQTSTRLDAQEKAPELQADHDNDCKEKEKLSSPPNKVWSMVMATTCGP